MERIPRLYDAARRDDIAGLRQLLNEDPQILDRVTSSTIYTETPLHVAVLAAKTDFARELISRKPSLLMEKNKEGLIPLHIASASGDLETVRELLTLGSGREQCVVKGQGGRIPLHDAVSKDRVSVIKLLISHCAESLEEVTERGETVFHLAAMNNQSEALQVVTERMKQRQNFMTIFNAKDKGGNNFWDQGQIKENHKESGKNRQLQNAMQIVAGLIVTATYQACALPPLTIWKKGRKLDLRCPNTCPAATFCLFMLLTTSGFITAFILIMGSGILSLRMKFSLLNVSISSLEGNYTILLANLTPNMTSATILISSSCFYAIIALQLHFIVHY